MLRHDVSSAGHGTDPTCTFSFTAAPRAQEELLSLQEVCPEATAALAGFKAGRHPFQALVRATFHEPIEPPVRQPRLRVRYARHSYRAGCSSKIDGTQRG